MKKTLVYGVFALLLSCTSIRAVEPNKEAVTVEAPVLYGDSTFQRIKANEELNLTVKFHASPYIGRETNTVYRIYLCANKSNQHLSGQSIHHVSSFGFYSRSPASVEEQSFRFPVKAAQIKAIAEIEEGSIRCKNGDDLVAIIVQIGEAIKNHIKSNAFEINSVELY